MIAYSRLVPLRVASVPDVSCNSKDVALLSVSPYLTLVTNVPRGFSSVLVISDSTLGLVPERGLEVLDLSIEALGVSSKESRV